MADPRLYTSILTASDELSIGRPELALSPAERGLSARILAQLLALVPVTIEFEAVEGSDMEGLPAVGNLRNATAVFYFDGGQWRTVGKTVFNMNPSEAILHFHSQYEPVAVVRH